MSKKALARIQRLCCLGIGGEMLMPDLMREVMGVVPLRHWSFFWAGPKAELMNAYFTTPASLNELFLKEFYGTHRETDFIATFRDHKLWPASKPVRQHRETLRVDRDTFLCSDFYNMLWREADIHDALLLLVRDRDRSHGVLSVHRAAGEVPFDSSDIKMLESIAGFVAHGMTRATAGEDAFADGDDRALFLADLDGTVQHASAQAQYLLMMALNPHCAPTAKWRNLLAPVPELTWLCHTLAATANGEVGQPPPVLRLRSPWGEFVLRAYRFGATDGAEQTRSIGITIERRVPRALALLRRVEGLPLTSREKQLCLLLARDPSRPDLADEMGVAVSTVITHQRSIYGKLGVHSRAELIAALQPG